MLALCLSVPHFATLGFCSVSDICSGAAAFVRVRVRSRMRACGAGAVVREGADGERR
jgi:hypothetical protein